MQAFPNRILNAVELQDKQFSHSESEQVKLIIIIRILQFLPSIMASISSSIACMCYKIIVSIRSAC